MFGLFSCASETTMVDNLNQIQDQNVGALAAKPSSDALLKKMIDKRFTFADKNKDKKLVFNEFKGLESEHEDVMQKMFNEVDTNKDKIVSYDEFVKADSEGISSTLAQMFAMLDSNRNKLIENNGELDMVAEIAHEVATGAGKKITLEEVKKDYLSYDADKNGGLSLEEYKSPELKYILMAPVDPYSNNIKTKANPVSMNRFVNDVKAKIKK